MEPVNYALEGRDLLYPDNIPTFARSKNIPKNWNWNPFSGIDKNVFGTIEEITLSTKFPESDIVKKCYASYQLLGGLGAETVDFPTSVITLDQILRGAERETRFQHTANRSNHPISLPITLKLEQLIDHGELTNNQSVLPKEEVCSHFPIFQVRDHRDEDSIVYTDMQSNLSLIEKPDSLLLGKRSRTTKLYSQVPPCQVLGYNKDLSSSKGYYKKHRVCDEHSKTAKVIVKGVEQRFCQQCSRFHLLTEFDKGKHSCRKCLAGHNERRRKPQLDTQWERRVPFLFPVIRRGSSLCQEKYANRSKRIKFEEAPTKSPQHHHVMRKENSSNIHPGATQPVQESTAGQNSMCALSLLSANSQQDLRSTKNHCAYLKRDHNLENYCGVSVTRRLTSNQLYPYENFGKDTIVQVLDDDQAGSSESGAAEKFRPSEAGKWNLPLFYYYMKITIAWCVNMSN
ncbi:unnamed protein product [Withania somnifera]